MTHPKHLDRMEQRKAQGLTYRELAEEHGMSKSHAHRLIKSRKEVEKPCDKD